MSASSILYQVEDVVSSKAMAGARQVTSNQIVSITMRWTHTES
jgi:hypothetical protein